MRPMNRASAFAVAGLTSFAAAAAAQAEYPERPIEMIVAFSAGGGTDIAARTLEPFVEKHLGGDITVLNKPGAGGEVGFTELATAEPTGYTVGFINTPNVLTIPIERDTRYSLESFAPVANIVEDPGAFAVTPDSQFQTLDELVAYAKEHPGEVTYGSSGIGSDDHLAGLAFERAADVQLQHVPFEGAADVRAATLGGHIDLGVFNMGEAINDAREGQLVILGQMAEERWEEAPDVPTFREQGYDVISGSNRGIAAPAGTPPEVVQALADAVEKTVADPEFQAKAKEQALPLKFLGPDEYQQMLETQTAEFQELWKTTPWVQK